MSSAEDRLDQVYSRAKKYKLKANPYKKNKIKMRLKQVLSIFKRMVLHIS